MDIRSLRYKFWVEGCGAYLIHRLGDDEFCLIQENDRWQVVYTERGSIQDVLFESDYEEESCDFLYQYVSKFRHNHLVGFFKNRAEAEAMSQELTRLKLPHHTDVIPYDEKGPRFRVFVYGSDWFTARNYFGDNYFKEWPSAADRLKIALDQLKKLDPNMDGIEHDVYSSIEPLDRLLHQVRLGKPSQEIRSEFTKSWLCSVFPHLFQIDLNSLEDTIEACQFDDIVDGELEKWRNKIIDQLNQG